MTTRTKFPPTITRASAGSGKTFALSNRYLDLAHHGVLPERILATTFARKAAGEILDRILIRLAEAASEEDKRRELASFLHAGNSLTRERCRHLLRQFASNLHRLRVGTIDSFFAQVARSFALELSVPPAWRIADPIEDDDVRDEAIEAVLAAQDETDLWRLVNMLTKGDAQRRISGLLRDTVGDLYQVYLDSSSEAWEQLPRYKPLDDGALGAALEQLRDLPIAGKGLQGGRDQDYALALAGDWRAFLSKGITKCVLNGQATYKRQAIEPHIEAVYQTLIDHAKAVLLSRTANFTLGAREFLTHFDDHYRRLKHRRRAMLFDDVTRAVMQLSDASNAEGLAFRMDGHIDHLLLDEFQDTSPAQWSAIRPMAERVVGGRGSRRAATTEPGISSAGASPSPSMETSFYCVGDIKQAIYGWRGGVAEIFATVEDQLGKMEEQTLAKSFRSSPVIIDTVNQVFEHLTNHTNLGRAGEAVTEFQNEFPHHETAKISLPGFACLQTAPQNDDDQKTTTLAFAAEQIKSLVEQAPGRSVGVLCRTNDTIAALIFELRQRGILASEEGGNPLTDSAAVQLIISLLKLADHPGDTIARHHVSTSARNKRWNIGGRRDRHGAMRISREVRTALLDDGYGPTILSFADELTTECNAREQNRLKQLVELAYGHAATPRVDDFIRLVQSQRVADPTAHPVRVTTIHRAKGLEFDSVVLPELDKGITGQPDKFVVHRENGTGPIDCIFEHVSQDLQQLLPKRFQQMITEATRRDVTETMCVLYVALTRAIHALHMIIPPSKENERTLPKKLSGLLRCTLKDTGPVPPSATIWEHGDPDWFSKLDSDDTTHETGMPSDGPSLTPLRISLAPALDAHTRSLDRVAPSRLHAAKKLSLSKVFAEAENTYAKDRGSLIHACFEQIEWLDDGPPTRDSLRRALSGMATGLIDVDAALDDFFAMLELGETRALLSRDRYASHAGKLVVRNEHEFAHLDDDGRLIQGSIDRLVLLYDGDQPIAADIIDFKTDADSDGAAGRHQDQLYAYRAAASRILKLPEGRISTRLSMVKNGTVIEV